MKTLIIFMLLILFNNFCFTQESWAPTTLVNVPEQRSWHTAVWTGSKMIIWGGQSNIYDLNTGGLYDLSLNSWTATNLTNVPSRRQIHTAVWTGSKMIIWGGICFTCGMDTFLLNTGGMYDPVNDSWETISTQNAPPARSYQTAVWTGSKMIIWAGIGDTSLINTGGIYDPVTNTWDSISTINAPSGRYWHTAVWTGSKMIVWGGDTLDFDLTNDGGIYDPVSDSWVPTSIVNAPSPRIEHTAVWTGTEMIIWGGANTTIDNSGGRYNPVTDSWIPTEILNAPQSRFVHTSVWTGTKMIIWGGISGGGQNYVLNTGGIYDPVTNTWLPTTVYNAPLKRYLTQSVWTGGKIILWGGLYEFGPVNSGAVYSNPLIIGLQTHNNDIPAGFSLSQNYPNPFNPVTNIRFNIPLSRGVTAEGGQLVTPWREGVFVKLTIFDILGREVTTLVNESMQPGSYSVDWDASNYPSGVYFYRIDTKDFTDSRKMILLK